MKRRQFLFWLIGIGVVFLTLLLFVRLYRNRNGYLHTRHVQELHYDIVKRTLPGQYKKKIIEKKTDIRKIVRMINRVKKKKIDQEDVVYGGYSTIIVLEDKNGNEIGHVYPYTGELWVINGEWYEVTDESAYQKLREYYFTLDYEEIDWDGKFY